MEDGAFITTTGEDADGIRHSSPNTSTGNVDVRVTGGSIATSGETAHGTHLLWRGAGASTISMSGGAIRVSGSGSDGIYVDKPEVSGTSTITVSGGSIGTAGGNGDGISFLGVANAADAFIRVTGGSITTEGATAHGVRVDQRGTGGVDVAMTGGTIGASGAGSSGIWTSRTGGGSTVTVNGVVMGGTGDGAGVHVTGGGRVVIGGNARVGARSGIAVRGAGSGELVVVVADPDEFGDTGLPRVQGRIEAPDGALEGAAPASGLVGIVRAAGRRSLSPVRGLGREA